MHILKGNGIDLRQRRFARGSDSETKTRPRGEKKCEDWKMS
jgi:hypothetical protein